MFVPAIRERLLRVRQSLARQIADKEFQRAQVRQFRRRGVKVLPTWPAERMILLRIIMNGDQRIWIEHLVNLPLGFGRTILILSRDMQHQSRAEIVGLAERLLDTYY